MLWIVFVLAITVLSSAAPAWSDVVDQSDPSKPSQRTLNADELWEFVSSGAEYALLDMATREQGKIIVGDGRIGVFWYFSGAADVAVLTRKGLSCIVIRRDQQPTKCIEISDDRLSSTCRFVARERRDNRVACLRKMHAP